MDTLDQIRKTFSILFQNRVFVPDKTGQNTVEILGSQFLADQDSIFGIPNLKYIGREIGWYMSKSLNINDMEPPIPKIWRDAASDYGMVNSNYGYLVYDPQNHSQFSRCLVELRFNQWSRRAVMIYT